MLYFEQKFFDNIKIQSFFENYNCSILKKIVSLGCYEEAQGSFYTRTGVGEFPLKNNFRNMPAFAMPKYDPKFANSWTDVTDNRCIELQKTKFDRPWVILWSGGIDSTTVVSAVIKNLSKADFENITIACSSVSIWENPIFYDKFIKPNFKTVDSQWAMSTDFIESNNYLITGEPGDQLFASGQLMFDKPHSVMHQTPLSYDLLFDFVVEKTDTEFAEWFCDFFIKNINSVDIPINSLHDASWWSQFNFNWVGVKMRMLNYGDWAKLKNAKVYFDTVLPWFDTVDYQKWAMVNNIADEKFGTGFNDAKLAAKKYIYNVDKNKYYRMYKTKMKSSDISSYGQLAEDRWCCMLDNYDLLNLQDHQEQILNLLPNHLN
jgi:hypothetical protein